MKIFNFSAGPAMLPKEVLLEAKKELLNWNKLGISVMEISHRNKKFIRTTEKIEKNLRDLLNIPKNYEILFCHGGARAQFSAVPLNLVKKYQSVDYIVSGYWSSMAIEEAKKYCITKNIKVNFTKDGLTNILPMKKWNLNHLSSYIHYCPNETIEGIAIDEEPDFKNKIVVADFSSTILSRPIDIKKYSIIYASAQKNIGPSGITLVIIQKDLIYSDVRKELPSILNYKIISEHQSMFNTPPTFSWYLSGLVFKWLKKKGGLKKISKLNKKKSKLLYRNIDQSSFYYNKISSINRSKMNVTFNLSDPNLNNLFIKKSSEEGLYALKGHKILGGMRASIYNSMPLEGIKSLVDFMQYFEKKYG